MDLGTQLGDGGRVPSTLVLQSNNLKETIINTSQTEKLDRLFFAIMRQYPNWAKAV